MSTPVVSKVKGTGYNQVQLPRLSPEQQQLFSQLIGGAKSGVTGGLNQLNQLAAGGNEDYWQQLEAPALKQFGELQGGLASRFSGMGSGARKSSGFFNTANTAASDLAQKLQGQRQSLQQNALSQLMQLYGNLIGTQTFDNAFMSKKKPFLQELLGSAASGIGQGIGFLPFL